MMDNAAGQPEGSGHEEKLPDRDLEVAEITRHLDELERTNRALRLLSAMNQALMHVTTEAELIKRICEIAVDVGLYRLAWVGFAEHDAARTVRPICHAGTELGYLHQLYFSWADDEHCDPAGMAIRTAKPTVLADIANMSTCAPWRAAALAHGLRSTIALPLQKDEQVIGALTLHGDAPDTFTPEEVQLLTELAGDLSFGITAIRTRDRQRRAEEALHESERRFRLLAENSTDIITRHTPEGVFRYVSPASRTLLGYAPEELVGHNAMQYVHSDDLAMVQTFYQQLLTQQHVNVSTLTFRGRRKDGEYRWLEITARAIRDTDTGHVIEFQVATRDVTERQQTAQALQESERRFRTLIANLPGMVYRCRNDQRWTMEYLSEGCRQLTGYAPDDLLQNAKLSYADLIHPDDAATVWEQVQRELQAHRPFQVTYRIVTASGAIKWVWEQGRAVVNAHGDVQSIEGYMTDITEWTEAEIAVKQREATLRAIFAAALNVSFIITDVDDRAPRVVEFSPGAEHIFGYTRDEMLGQPVNRLHRQEDIAQFPATHRAMREGHAGFSGETVLIRKNSDAFPALFSTYPLFDEQGNMYAALGVSIDITEQKRIEEQLRQTGEELDQFFNLAPDLLAIADTDGHFRRLNPSWERTLGYTREELLAGLFFDFVHPDDLASTHEAVAQLSAQRRVINFVNRFRCRDGSYRWIEWLSASAGTRIYAAARDITDRLHAEEALRESEQRYRMLIERLPLPVAIYGASGDVEYLNNQFVKVLGYTLADIPTIADWWPRAYPNPEYRREVMTVWTEALADAERSQTDIAPHEYRVTCKDGTVRTMEILAKNMGNTYLILWNDVTERRRTEAALRLKEYQLEESQRNAHIGTYVLDIPAGCWTSSAGLDDLFGITPDYPHTLVGWLGIIHPDNREMMAHYLPEIAIPNRVFNKVYRIVRQNDGALRWVWGLGKITCSQEGVPREMIGTIQDITERKLAEDALRESEERFRTLIEKAPVAIGMARHMFGIYANPAYERMFRLRGPEDAAVPVIERYATQIRDWMIENLRAREEGQPTAMEFDTIGLRADGTEFPMHVAITRVSLPEGETTLAFITDITERIRAEDALKASEERLRFALEGANEGVWEVNVVTHTILYMSPRDQEILGYAPTEIAPGLTVWEDYINPDDLSLTQTRLANYLAGRAPFFEVEQRLRMKSGDWKWVLARGKVVEFDAEQRPLRMTGTHTDITERKLAEQALQREQLFTNAILDSVPGLLYVYNADGYLVRWNKRHEEITGYSAEELAHKQFLDWYQGEPEDTTNISNGVEKALQEGYAEAEGRLITKSGTTILFAFTAVRMVVEGEMFFVGIGIDITARRQAEEERERLFAENTAQRILFESIVRDAPAGIVLLQGPEHRYVLANPAYLPLISGKRDVIGRSVAEVFSEIASTVVPLLDRVYQTGEPFSASDMPLTVVRDGVPCQVFISFTYTPWRDARGQIQGVLVLATDTTAQVRAREEVEQERSLLSTVLAVLPVGIFILDAEGKFVHTNDAVRRIWGGNLPQVKSISDYGQFIGWWADSGQPIAPEEWAGARAVLHGETIVGEVINIQRFDRTTGTILNSTVPLRDADEKITGAVIVIQDITELKQAEETINRERAFLASAIELLPFPIFFASTSQAIFRTNQACRTFLHEDGLDQWWDITLLDPNTHEPIAREDRGLTGLFSGEAAPPPREVTMVFPNGREMPALLFMAPIAVGKESIAAVIAFQDITLIKEADQAKNQFLKVISHELRTPLTSIIGWAKMLQEAPEIMPEAVPIILQSAHQFEGLLERMIILSRILTGKLTTRQETVNLCTLATEVETEFQPAAARKGVILTWLPPAESPQTEGDTHLIRMAFSELVDNAINFTPAGGRVTLTCHTTPDDRVTFTVTDTGRGITTEELPNIMKPFSQFRREEAIGGIGIGLTLVQGIAHAHHGEVVATSPGIDQGATVTMILPMALAERHDSKEA